MPSHHFQLNRQRNNSVRSAIYAGHNENVKFELSESEETLSTYGLG